jgi:hypothetical protein
MNEPVGIAILTHWHTGSSLLAKQFKACGMKVGDVLTYWDDRCIQQMEHSLLNEIGDQIWIGNKTTKEYRPLAKAILTSYAKGAIIEGWKVFGVKFTHALYPECWPMFRDLFLECWQNLRIVSIARDVNEIFKSTRDPLWPFDRVEASYLQCKNAMEEIAYLENGYILNFPNSWETGEVKNVAKECGLTWNYEAENLYSGR